MCPPPTNEAITDPSLAHVVRCERIEAGPRTSLVRVTLALGAMAPSAAAGAQLVVVDGEQTSRSAALPAPVRAAASTVTLGFAVPASATLLGLVLGGRSLPLAGTGKAEHELEERLRATQARLAEARRAQADAEAELAEARRAREQIASRLAESRRAHLGVERARDAALGAVARAEAAAHDASARAETLARRLSASDVGAPRTSLRVAGVAAGLGLATVLAAILAWPARDAGTGGGVRGVAAASASPVVAPKRATRVDPLAVRLNIPADYLALYRRAGARYGLDWTRLAAIGAIESGHGQARMLGITSGASTQGAVGPAQFLPGTWERYGLDGDGDGARDPRNPADAVLAMASYLRASGAPQDWRAALRAYNHSDAYVTAVETLAASLRSNAS